MNATTFAAERPALVAHGRRLGLQPADAEDLAQDTLVKAIRFQHRFDGTNVRAWLLRILVNTFMSDRRRHTPEPTDEAAELPAPSGVDGLLDSLHLAAVLATIPPPQAEAIVLHHGAGWRHRDIATRQGVAGGTVAGRIHRGLHHARRQMEQVA